MIQSIKQLGFTAALLQSFDTSAIAWCACGTGLLFILREKQEAILPTDLLVTTGSLVLIMLPTGGGISWLAVTGFCLYMLLFTKTPPTRRRGALILLATTVPMLWIGLIFHFFTNPILSIDASMVASVLGTDRLGNTVRFADASGSMTIWPPCSSLVNLPYALLIWVVLGQAVGRRWSARNLLWSLSICAVIIAANVIRLSVMGLSADYYTAIHSPLGDTVVNLTVLSLAAGISLLGSRHELFSRA